MKIDLIKKLVLASFFISLIVHHQVCSQSKYDLDSLLKALDNSPATEDRYSTLVLLSRNSYNGKLSLDERITFLESAIEIDDSIDSVELRVFNKNELGRLRYLQGKPEISLEIIYEVIELAKKEGLVTWVSNGYGNLANIYRSLGDLENAYASEKASLSIILETTDSLLIFNGLSNHAETLYKLGRTGELDSIIKFSKTFFRNGRDPNFQYVNAGISITQSYISAQNRSFEESDSLFQYAEKVLAIYKNRELDQTLALAAIQLAKIYLTQDRIKRSIELAQYGYDIGMKHHLNEVIRNGSEVLYKAFEKQEDIGKSNQYLKSYYQYRDTLLNLENVKKVESLRADFEISQKQSEVDLLESQKEARDQFLLALGIIVLLLIIGSLIVFRSLQLQRRLSRELTSQKIQLEQLNHAKDKLFSIISHDLRGPIIAFRGVGKMINLGVQKNDKDMLKQVALEVSKTSTKLNDMLENLLAWAMQEQDLMEPKKGPILVSELFEEMEGIYKQQAQAKQIELNVASSSREAIYADKNAVSTIFRNLIGNALKFTPNKGKISIEAHANTDTVDIKVTDNGVGITEEKQTELFTFQSAKPSFGTSGEKGLGLGLNLVQSMVQANNGTISVISQLHKGSVFTVTLPRVPQ